MLLALTGSAHAQKRAPAVLVGERVADFVLDPTD